MCVCMIMDFWESMHAWMDAEHLGPKTLLFQLGPRGLEAETRNPNISNLNHKTGNLEPQF